MSPATAERLREHARAAAPLYRVAWLLFALALAFRFFDTLGRVALLAYAAAIFAVALNGIANHLPLRRKWTAALLGIGLLALFAAAVWFGGAALLDQIRDLSQRLPEMEEELRRRAESLQERIGIDFQIFGERSQSMVRDIAGDMDGRRVLSGAYGAVEVLALIAIVFFGGIFALAKPNENLLTPLLRAVPADTRPAVRRFATLLGERLLGWVKAQLIAMATVGLLATVAFWLIGVPYALLLGVVNGLVEFVPIVGPWVGGVPAIVVAFLDDPTKGLWTAGAILVIQQIESQLVTPLVMAKVAEVHPFVTLFSLLLFGGMFGILGVLLALPLVLFIWTAFQVFWVERAIGTDEDQIRPVVAQ